MSEFKAIETQEALDAIIKERIERVKKSAADEAAKKYEGWVSPEDAKKTADQIAALTAKVGESETQIADLKAKNSAYEIASVKTKIAHEIGLPYELAQRLSGANEDEIRKDAETLSKFAAHHQATPDFSGETPEKDTKNAALREVLRSLNNEV